MCETGDAFGCDGFEGDGTLAPPTGGVGTVVDISKYVGDGGCCFDGPPVGGCVNFPFLLVVFVGGRQ